MKCWTFMKKVSQILKIAFVYIIDLGFLIELRVGLQV